MLDRFVIWCPCVCFPPGFKGFY